MFTCHPCSHCSITINSANSTCNVMITPSQSWKVRLYREDPTRVRCTHKNTSLELQLSGFQNLFGTACTEALFDHYARNRYNSSKKYRNTHNGRMHTQEATLKYRTKNMENAYRSRDRYTKKDLEYFDKILSGELTISQVAVALERSNQAIQGKLHRIRRSM